MGDTKLFILLLFYAIIFTDAQEDEAVCLLAKRYKSFHKYEYLYEAESLNTLNGAVNGPRVSCKVVIEVPGTCHFIVHTNECSLSEVISVDADGNPVFGSSAGAETFRAQMEKNTLKVIVEGTNDIKLFPEDDELTNILNIKRGIISALAVPVLQEDKNKNMPTIYGLCDTEYTVNAREDIATDVTLERDLSSCDHFSPIKDHTSPLAIFTGMHYPLAQFFRSKQTCSYKFHNDKKHMTSGVCTENHLLLPFSHKEKHGINSVSKQTLSLLDVTEYNDRLFDHKEANMKTLHLDKSVDQSPNQDENTILDVLRELSGLSQTANGHKRAHLAHKLVAVIRKSNADTLSAALPKALEISPSLTYQALFQCGTPECSSVLMQVLRTFESSSTGIDAAVYAMAMVPNPSRVLVKEMLEMAKFKSSKLIYYATSNAVRRFYKAEGKITPEVKAVADYALENIGDCTGDQEHIYLTLRVIGNMAEAVGAASPELMSAVIQCINQPAASTDVQQAAIQVFRLTPIPEEGRTVLKQVLLDGAAPIQKRIAAYLILMKDPQPDEFTQLAAALPSEENLQVKSFVTSHLTNILSSTAQETEELRQKILDSFQGNMIGDVMDAMRFSRNYKIGSLEGNMIFDNEHQLPAEVMLEMTLNAFGYNIDMAEFGMEGKGLEPTVEALFGQNGFFPDTVMKTIYYAADKMPSQVTEYLKTMIPSLNEKKTRQGPKNIIKEISKNFDKLMKNLKTQDAPEAMFYLRMLGAELGYLKTKDLEEMSYTVTKVAENLLKMFPIDCARSLFSSADNELFLHYIFMDNEFYLPTGPGLPLRVALSGVFTPGIKGGLRISRDMSEISFMPSAGVEFVTEVGAHLPDYVHSGLEMHTNIYHESGMRAKVAMTNNQIKLSIPAPESPMKVLSVSNSLVSVAGDKVTAIPAMEHRSDTNECAPLFPGVKYCKVLQFSNAMYNDDSPFFPLSGDSKFAIELHPTADVSEYTATISHVYEMNTDTVTFDVKAEGTTFEAISKVMFNRKDYTVSAELQIPDFDIEAGIRIGADQSSESTHSIQIDFINKNIPQASLIGQAKIEAMKDALLQVQLLVPILDTDAKVSASLKREDGLTLKLISDLKFLDTSSVQKLTLKYDEEKVESQLKSDVSYKTENLVAMLGAIKDLLDQNIGQRKVSDVLASSVEATHSYIKASRIPYVENLRIPSCPELDVPKTLFLNIDTGAKYYFGKNYYTIILPVPLGGKSSKDLNIPSSLTTPNLAVPQLGLNIASVKVPLPEVFVPKTLTLHLPTFGKAEVAGKLNSSVYALEANASAGRDSDEHQSYSARFNVTGSGPVDLLSFRTEGSTLITGIMTDTLKAEMNTAINHALIDARLNIAEEIKLMDKTTIKSNSKLQVTSPFNVKFSLEHTGEMSVDTEEFFGDSALQGSFVTDLIDGNVNLKQSLSLLPFTPKAIAESTIEVSSTSFKAQNKIVASFINGELSFASNSAAFENMLTHNAQVTLTRSTCALKSDTKALALGLNIHNIAEANIGPEDISIRIETETNHSEDHVKSVIVATLNFNGLLVSSDASVKLAQHTATHKASVTLDKNGLALSTETRGKLNSMAIDNTNSISATLFSIDVISKSKIDLAEDIMYIYDISLQAKPYTATAGVTSHLKIASDTELKNTCEIKLADLSGNAKCSTAGKLFGAHMSHDTEIEIAGLAVKINNDARFNSQLVRFSTMLQATAAPFTFNLRALANGDGELYLFGKHSAQVYTKVLLNAEPLALAHSHECRFSTTHELDNSVILETNFNKKVDTQLSLSEQSAIIAAKAKINNNEFNQELSLYNNPEKIGLEVSGVATFRESQDFSISALIQYDKNAESHVINLSLLETLPAVLENLKITAVTLVEALQDYIKREEFIVKIQTLVQHITDSVTEFNLEEKVEQLKRNLITFAQHCPITTEELEAAVGKLRTVTLEVMAELSTRFSEVQELILSGALSDTVMQKITSLNEKYDIRAMLLAVIEAIENVIKQIDVTKLEGSSVPVFYDVEKLNIIKLHLQQYAIDLKNVVADFDKAQIVEQVQNAITTTEKYTEQLLAKIPKEDISKMADTLKKLITELDIIDRCKAIYSSFRDFLVKYELDKRTAELLDKLLELIKQLKIDETIQAIGTKLKSIHNPLSHLLDDFLSYLTTTDIKVIIDDLNRLIEAFISSLKSFEYNAFVDEANQKLSELSAELNKLYVSLELPQKLEASREFINYHITLPHISLPTIPKLDTLDIPLQIPEIKLPKIPSTLILPALGKLHGKIKVITPVYALNTHVEVQNSTDSEQMHQFTALINSAGESSHFDILNYNLDATMRIGLPKMSRVVISDTLKFIHSALTVEHLSSVTLYGLSAQATAQTTVKVTTIPYTADIVNRAFLAVEGGMSASVDTSYKHKVNVALLSLSSEATLTQSTVVSQNDGAMRLTIGNTGTGTFDLSGFSDEGTHKSDLTCTIMPTSVKLTFTGDTDSATLKFKEVLNVDAVPFSHINFNGRIETQSLFIKSSVIVASGRAHLRRMKVEVDATHDTELIGAVSGTLSNAVSIKVRPVEINVAIQNKGNGKVSLEQSLSTKFDLQNDYILLVNSKKQHINTVALFRFSQHKYSYNFTIDNNNVESGIYAAVNGETDLAFLTIPVNTPEIVLPVVDLTIPAMNDVNLYKASGLEYFFTTKPTIDANAKIVYQKSKLAPIINLRFISVPAVGNLNSEMSFKTPVFNLNTNAEIYGDNDLVIRIAATSTSVFDYLKAKLEGTSSITLKRGLKLASAVSLKHAYIEGTHNSTLMVNTKDLQATAAVTTAANLNLPILIAEVNHKLLVDTKSHPIAVSTLTITQNLDLPIIKAVGSSAAEHVLKLDGVSIESTTKGSIDGTFLKTGIVKGALDNEASMHMSVGALRSKVKTIGDVNFNHGSLKVECDVNENFDMELQLSRVHVDANIISNNEVNIATFNTKGKHVAKATVDLAPMSSLVADVEFDLSQPNNLGDFTIFEKTVVDLTLLKQKISYSTKMVSPVYTTNNLIEMEVDAPIFKTVFKSSSKSPVVLLEYDLDSYLSTTMENEVLTAKAKAFLEHTDFTIDFNSVFIPSDPSHTLNVDISSSTFTDVNLRYAAQRDGVTASISSPSAGLLGYQLTGKIPSQLTSRLYSHYASTPETDIDLLNVNVAVNGNENIHFQADVNLEAPQEIVLGLKDRLPAITSTITIFAEKYGILGAINGLRATLVSALTEAYTISHNHAPDLSQLSVLFRNVVVQHQKAFQQLLNAAITFLRETQIKLPGVKETTLSEICQQIKSNIALVIEEFINAISTNLKTDFSPIIKTIRITLPYGEILTGDDILGYMENALTRSLEMMKKLESLDVILEKLGQTVHDVVKITEDIIPNIQFDFLDDILATINTFYTNTIILVTSLIEDVNRLLSFDSLNVFLDGCMQLMLSVVNEFKNMVYVAFPVNADELIFHIQNGRLKMDISVPFHQ